MMLRAFNGDPAVKVAAIAEAGGPEARAWAVEATDEERDACSERFGLAPSLLALLSHAFHVPYGERAVEKLTAALTAIPVGADSLAIVRNWVLQIWDRPDGLHAQLQGTPLQGPADQVIELVRRSARESVRREEWRRARAAVNQVAAKHETLLALTELVGAMAWDLTTSPRAVIDIWNAWSGSVTIPLNDAAGFPQRLQDEVFQAVRDSHVAASGEVGQHDPAAESAAAYGDRLAAVLNREMAQRGRAASFDGLQKHLGTTLVPALQAWHAKAEQSIVDACAQGGA